MAKYTVSLSHTNVGTVTTPDAVIELLPPTDVSIALTAVRVARTNITPTDAHLRVEILRTSTNATNMVDVSEVKRRPDAPTPVTVVKGKTGSVRSVPGTTVDLLLRSSFYSRGDFEWKARDYKEYLWSNVNQNLLVTVGSSSADTHRAEVDWLE